MKNFRFLAIFLVVALCATFLVSCEKDDDIGGNEGSVSKIVATNVNIPVETATIKAHSGSYYDSDVIAQTPYNKNNGFTLELPASLSANYLRPISSIIVNEDIIQFFSISDKTVRWCWLGDIVAYDSDDRRICDLEYIGENDYIFCDGLWLYVNKDVVIKGTHEDHWGYVTTIDLNLKKGWNTCYRWEDDYSAKTDFFTSKKPSGLNFAWESWYN